jgi:hypothetical protein
MDRDSSERSIKAGLAAAAVAVFFFGFAFYVAVLYLP